MLDLSTQYRLLKEEYAKHRQAIIDINHDVIQELYKKYGALDFDKEYPELMKLFQGEMGERLQQIQAMTARELKRLQIWFEQEQIRLARQFFYQLDSEEAKIS